MASAPGAEELEARTKTAAAEYIAIEASRLARMANANDFALLAYLIDMAVLEAWREASEAETGQNRPPGGHGRTNLSERESA